MILDESLQECSWSLLSLLLHVFISVVLLILCEFVVTYQANRCTDST